MTIMPAKKTNFKDFKLAGEWFEYTDDIPRNRKFIFFHPIWKTEFFNTKGFRVGYVKSNGIMYTKQYDMLKDRLLLKKEYIRPLLYKLCSASDVVLFQRKPKF